MTAPGDALGSAASRGAAVTVGAQLLRLVVQLGGVVVLARLLEPDDYGLFTMILVVIGVADIVRDFGLGQAAVQARTLSGAERTNLFWANAGIGAALTLVVLAAAQPIAALYGEPDLRALALALAPTFLIRGLTVQYTADLSRSLRFGRLASAEIAGQLAGLAGGIVLASAGWGVWALVWQQILQALVALVLCGAFARWLPGRYARGTTIRPFVRFGVAVAGSHLLNYASRNVDALALGLRFGPETVGVYNRAFQLVMMPLSQLQAPATRVALPVLARLQDSPQRFARFLLTGQFAMLLVVGTISSVCVARADVIVRAALGPGWDAAVPVFQALAVGGMFQAATYAGYWVFLAKGLSRHNLLYAVATRPFAIVAIVLAAQGGVMAVAWTYVATLAVFWPVSLLWLWRVSDAPAGRMFASGARCVAVFAAATGLSLWAGDRWPSGIPLVDIAVSVLIVLAAIAAGAVLPAFRRQLGDVVALRRLIASDPRKTATEGT